MVNCVTEPPHSLLTTHYSLLTTHYSLLTTHYSPTATLLAPILLAPADEPRIIFRPFVHAAAFRTDRRGGHDRELIGGAYLDTGGNPMTCRGAVDHDDSHDLLLYLIVPNRARNLGDGVTR